MLKTIVCIAYCKLYLANYIKPIWITNYQINIVIKHRLLKDSMAQ